MKDITTMDMLKAFTKKLDPQNLTYILHHQRGGLICGRSGIWYCPEYKHLLHVCRGSIEGEYHTRFLIRGGFYNFIIYL